MRVKIMNNNKIKDNEKNSNCEKALKEDSHKMPTSIERSNWLHSKATYLSQYIKLKLAKVFSKGNQKKKRKKKT